MSKYKLKTVSKISTRPIVSIGAYVSLDAECIVAGSSDRHLRFMDKDSLEEIAKCRVDKKSVNCVSISEMSPEGDDPIIVTGGKDSSVQIWNPSDGSLEKNIELPTKEVRSLAIYQGSETYLVIGTKEAKVIVWDVRYNRLVAIFEGHKASVHCVSITSSATDLETQRDMDFLCIASGGADRTVRTWDLATGKRRKKFRHKRSIAAMVVANKGIRPLLATGGVERVIKLWDVETGVLLRTLEGHLDQINCLALWEGYQMLLISGSSDHTIRIYDILSGECVCVLLGHADAVLGVTIIDNDHPKVVSCSEDLTLIQWSLHTVLGDFFCADEENLGSRNIVPPYLPAVEYVAPPELDKKTLTKEERKRLRKEAKRAKKLKGSSRNLTADSSTRQAGGELREEDEEEGADPYNEDFEDEIAEDLAASQQTAAAAAAETADVVATKSDGELSSAAHTEIAFSNRVQPEGGGGATVRKASVVVMKNIMSKVLGFGSAAAVGVEPLSPVPETHKRSSQAEAGGRESEESNLRALANAAQNKFNIAEVEKELQADRMKSKAAEKLAFRLNMKKLAASQAGGAAGGGEAVSEEALSEAALQSIKAEKLRQHKLQEGRRHQSMMVAKERSSNTLQKRLDELAAKRKLLPPSFEEQEDSEDSDKEGAAPGGKAPKSGRQSIDMAAAYTVTATTNELGETSTVVSAPAPTTTPGGGRATTFRKKIIYISDEEEEDLSDDEDD